MSTYPEPTLSPIWGAIADQVTTLSQAIHDIRYSSNDVNTKKAALALEVKLVEVFNEIPGMRDIDDWLNGVPDTTTTTAL